MGMTNPRRVLAALVLAGLLFPVFWSLYHAAGMDETRLIEGTWTNPQGEEGNYLRIYLVESPLPTAIPLVKAYEGRMVVHNLLGHEHLETGWNFESLQPLRLSIFEFPRAQFAAMTLVDASHLRLRFGSDLSALSQPDVFASPETLDLVRTRPPEPAP